MHMKTMYVSSTELENMKRNNLLYESPIRTQSAADRLNEKFDTDEFVVVTAELTNSTIKYK